MFTNRGFFETKLHPSIYILSTAAFRAVTQLSGYSLQTSIGIFQIIMSVTESFYGVFCRFHYVLIQMA